MKTITALVTLISALPVVSTAYADNANEFTDGSACRDVSVVWAKGTNQNGNLGEAGDMGPVLLNALAALLPSGAMAAQGVAGDFTIATWLKGGSTDGVNSMTDLVLSRAEDCPNTKIVMAGYSQGAEILHTAANSDLFMVNPLLVNHVVAYLTFGDPEKDQYYSLVNNLSKVKVVCHSDDSICQGSLVDNAAHHTYQADAPAAAAWLVERINAGFNG